MRRIEGLLVRNFTNSKAPKNMQITVVISTSHSEPDRVPLEDALARLCAESGMEVLVVSHIYHLPEHDPVWESLSKLRGEVVLASWLHPRPAEWVFRKHWHGEHLTAVNVADYASAEECHAEIARLLRSADAEAATVGGEYLPGAPRSTLSSQPSLSDRWYPVVDRSRCINCRNCLQFCLFGVYETGPEGEVMVCKPDSCKHGCPACSRICPVGAIMFPLYVQSAAIAGAPGLFMSPDAAARRMFYARTKGTCPVCGSTESSRVEAAEADVCSECGRPVPGAPDAAPGLRDEIDQLIDDLDSLTGRD